MRISDWSSDVCSSDLAINYNRGLRVQAFLAFAPTGDLRFQRAWTWILSKSEKKSWGLPTRILPQPSKSTFPQCPNCLAASASLKPTRRKFSRTFSRLTLSAPLLSGRFQFSERPRQGRSEE